MITNVVEQGKKKCEQYWPEVGSSVYGLLEVVVVQETVQVSDQVVVVETVQVPPSVIVIGPDLQI